MMIDSPQSLSRRKNAFGLLELTIVIGLIVVLVMLALSGVKAATTAGRSAKCISQLKQIYVGIIMYSQDYNGHIPAAMNPIPGTTTWTVPWTGTWCAPSSNAERGFPKYITGGIEQARKLMICPENIKATPNYQNPSHFRHYYLCNYDLMTSSGYSDPPARLSEIELHNTTLIFDAATGTNWGGTGVPSRVYGTQAWNRIGENHGGRLNVLWADGHITTILKKELTREHFERKPLN